MKPPPFVYHAPRTVEETVAVLGDVGSEGKVLAGGQSLIPLLNMRLASPGHLVDINAVAGLDSIEVLDDAVRVGALVRHTSLEHDDDAYAALPLLREATHLVAHPVIRNRGTTVGSVAHADPAGEMPAVLALTGGAVEAVGPRGAREVSHGDFFAGPLETTLASDELVVAVRFGRLPTGTGTAFEEATRRHGDYALAGAAAAVTVEDGGVRRARVSFVSVTDVPSVIDVPSSADAGGPASGWDGAVDAVREHVSPEADIHATADYRRALVGELARRALTRATSRALGEDGARERG